MTNQKEIEKILSVEDLLENEPAFVVKNGNFYEAETVTSPPSGTVDLENRDVILPFGFQQLTKLPGISQACDPKMIDMCVLRVDLELKKDMPFVKWLLGHDGEYCFVDLYDIESDLFAGWAVCAVV